MRAIYVVELTSTVKDNELLFDFITGKVIVYTARERKLSRTRAHQRRLQHLAGGHAIPR
jgi:hypothetical protein